MRFEKQIRKIYDSGWYQKLKKRNGLINRNLRLLYPGEDFESVVWEYHYRKIRYILIGLCVCAALLFVGVIWNLAEYKRLEISNIERPDTSENSRIISFDMIKEDGKKASARLQVSERQYTKEEEEALLDQAKNYLDKHILSENESPDHIDRPLYLPRELSEFDVQIQWISDKPEILQSDGTISKDYLDKNGTYIQLKALISSDTTELIQIWNLKVYPLNRSDDEMFWDKLLEKMKGIEKETREEAQFALPNELDGEKIIFRREAGKECYILAMLTAIISILIFFNNDEKLSHAMEKRTDQLLMDYPELISKLSILIKAGMTPRTAIEVIVSDYKKMRTSGIAKRYMYEELTLTYQSIRNGRLEEKAYEEFGKRCGLLIYMRLGGLLSQNIRTGNKRLIQQLKDEATQAMEDRKRRAKKKGEEAGTKILLPMLMMLIVTIVLILYPAFSAFQL